jgi:NarL family two-component system response regulator LiaR
MMEAEHTSVLVVDDHSLVRTGITFSLLAFEDLEVVGQASTAEEGLRLVEELAPDVVLMDLMMPGMGGVAAIRLLHERAPDLPVLALTSFQEGELVQQALQAGALSYLLKNIEADELAKAIRLARRGLPVLAAEAAQAVVRAVASRPPALGHDLTGREREVLGLLAKGLSNNAIAERLVITAATVKFHTRSIRSKLCASSRTEIVSIALRHHLVPDA